MGGLVVMLFWLDVVRNSTSRVAFLSEILAHIPERIAISILHTAVSAKRGF